MSIVVLLADSEVSALDVVKSTIILVFVLMGAFALMMWLRRWLRQDAQPVSKVGFTLGDMRDLLKQGKITPEEFDTAKNQMVAASQRALERATQEAKEAAEKKDPLLFHAIRKNKPVAPPTVAHGATSAASLSLPQKIQDSPSSDLPAIDQPAVESPLKQTDTGPFPHPPEAAPD